LSRGASREIRRGGNGILKRRPTWPGQSKEIWLHARKENGERSSRGQNVNIHVKADNFYMVPLTPEVKRNARLEHDRRQAERRFADRMKIKLLRIQAKRLTLGDRAGQRLTRPTR
jgi:hypothetical protein